MADDVRLISVQVEATGARNQLIKVGGALNDVSLYAGMSSKQMRAAERAIANAAKTSTQAARTIQSLKTQLNAMSKEQTKSAAASRALNDRLTTANKRLAEQKAIVAQQNAVISRLSKSNVELANSYNQVAAAAGRAANATQRVKPPVTPVSGAAAPAAGAAPRSGGVKAFNNDLDSAVEHSNALRYQLYDVAATFGVVGAAALVAGTAVIRAGIEWDKNFANVIRTSQVTGNAVGWLKEEFLELQSIVPVTAADLATIGTLGAQMGVAASNLVEFTETTAKFAATAGVSVDEAATALSRISQLLPDVAGNYDMLASIILKTGVNAVATEAQIIRGTSNIAAMGRIAGLTAPEIIALSSSLSSLGFSPELQRSIVTSSFSKILTATSQVTAKTEAFGAVLNMTGKQFQQAWNEDAIGTYKDLLSTIAGRSDAVTVLTNLGLASQRLTPNLLKLGQNTDVLATALSDTRGEAEATTSELTRQYDIMSGTVSAKIQVMSQAWEALLVTLDGSATPLKFIIERITDLLKLFRQISNNPVAATFATIGTAVAAAAGVMTLAAAGAAGLAAGYIAIINANAGLLALTHTNTASTAANTGVVALNTTAISANSAARAANNLGLGASLPPLAANTAAMGANGAASTLANSGILRFSSSIITALPNILKWTGVIGAAAAGATALGVVLATTPTWKHDMEKFFSGTNTSQKTIDFDIKKIKAYKKELDKFDKLIEDRKIGGGGTRNDGTQYGNYTKEELKNLRAALSGEGNRQGADSPYGAVLTDLEDEINSLETVEAKYAAINQVSKDLGVSQKELLTNILPSLGSSLGDNAVGLAEEAEAAQLAASAMSLWAAQLNTSDESLIALTKSIAKGAASFLDFGNSFKTAYGEAGKGTAGTGDFTNFSKGIDQQIKDFESFYADLGSLVQTGGVQLASFFADQGPVAANALADSLKMGPEAIAKIEEQMSLAAFYSSKAFAETFQQNNSILASVWTQTGGDSKAVAAFNKALNASMKGGEIDPGVLARLAKQFDIELDVGMIPTLDPDVYDAAVAAASATATPIKIPVTTTVGQGDFTASAELDAWVVTMEGHTITLPVDPNTQRGNELLAEWRANQYQTPVSIRTFVETNTARAKLLAFFADWNNRYVNIGVNLNSTGSGKLGSGMGPGQATGGLAGTPGKYNLPGYANGTILRGPGTSTSDSILARLSKGEAVTRAKAVRHYGPKFFEDVNMMRFPKFAGGTHTGGGSGAGAGTVVNATVIQNYPTTQDPIKKLKQDAESVIAGIWS